ncbi:MAG TPA: sigma-70 family RNA polymerase sigma factor [Planctomycetota bacterium]|nr:sigma-70 family RNA polymerase sigma factor [Planctomycetota bacterium]
MPGDTTMGGSKRGFQATLWTVVLKAKDHSRDALEELIKIYWKPVYVYIRRWGYPSEESKDLSQGFFSDLLERDFLRGVSPEKGRFRTFLLTVLKRYLINESERKRAQKRGGGKAVLSLDYTRAERDFTIMPTSDETPERSFNRQWALEAMSRALGALAKEMDSATFEAIKPHLAGGPAYEGTARKLGITVTRLNNLIHRTRKRYRDLLRAQVSGSLNDPAEADEEVRNLLDAVKS